jgi:hypothetical protein
MGMRLELRLLGGAVGSGPRSATPADRAALAAPASLLNCDGVTYSFGRPCPTPCLRC